jgi:hypothetical protein
MHLNFFATNLTSQAKTQYGLVMRNLANGKKKNKLKFIFFL